MPLESASEQQPDAGRMLRVYCKCGQRMRVTDAMMGQIRTCVACRQNVRIPARSQVMPGVNAVYLRGNADFLSSMDAPHDAPEASAAPPPQTPKVEPPPAAATHAPYEGFYGFARQPFNPTPDPSLLFRTRSHNEAFAAIQYGIAQRKGFVALTGEVGTGKTMVLRWYLQEGCGEKLHVVCLFEHNLTLEQLLHRILQELGCSVPVDLPAAWMLQQMRSILTAKYAQGINVALIIDEAQHVPAQMLEQLRMLSNLETPTDKLLQIVLVGQPELDAILDRHEMRQLRQRIAVRARLGALSRAQSVEYLRYRISQAGGQADHVFTPAALRAIARYAKGVPRALNILSDNALLTGFAAEAKPVTARIVREVAADIGGSPRRRALRWVAAALAGIALGALALFAVHPWLSAGPETRVTREAAIHDSGPDAANVEVSAVSGEPEKRP